VPRFRAGAAAIFTELVTGSNNGEPYTLPDPANGATAVSALLLVPACEVLGPLFFGPRLSALDGSAKTAHEFFAVAQALLKAGGKWMNDPGKVSVVDVCVLVRVVCVCERERSREMSTEREREREKEREIFDDKGPKTHFPTTLPHTQGSDLA